MTIAKPYWPNASSCAYCLIHTWVLHEEIKQREAKSFGLGLPQADFRVYSQALINIYFISFLIVLLSFKKIHCFAIEILLLPYQLQCFGNITSMWLHQH